MIDLHAHLLPGVDDGPRTWDESLRMAREAAETGTEVVIATAHMQPEGYPYRPDPRLLQELLAELRERLAHEGIPLRVELGGEVLFSADLGRRLAQGRALPLAGSHYLLVDLPGSRMPAGFEEYLFELQLDGYEVVLAHPERHPYFQFDPLRAAALVERGVYLQVTAGSLLGQFGSDSQKTAAVLCQSRLVHFLASDGHSPGKRPAVLGPGYARLQGLVGNELAHWLTREGPARVLEDRPARPPQPAEPPPIRLPGLPGSAVRWGRRLWKSLTRI